ncbi:MAG: nucleotidyltransferase substrate binding protein [Spirochaetaceae bacterium]|jgi:nucleotidyltransferase substrate binding protein (TIGR01987 family)|nr:nucleotidyltransferase substrate binding protein [Spirochaetaceae bacterium]
MSPQEYKEIRWKQRFENFSRAYTLLKEASETSGLSRLEKEGLIQRFEYTFELAWKTVKDYLEAKGVVEKFPRDVLKTAVSTEILKDGQSWMNMLDSRNQLSHCYDEKSFEKVVQSISREYTPAIYQLFSYLKVEMDS